MDRNNSDNQAYDSEDPPTESNPLLPASTVAALSKKQECIAQIQFLSLCWSFFLIGWNDGSTGPLLPRIQKEYNVDFAKVSYVFMASYGGLMLGAFPNMRLTDRLGFGKMLFLGSLLQIVAFGMQFFVVPFPLFVLSFVIGGTGRALQDSQGNGFVASLRHNSDTKMGFLHAAYGSGALMAPLSATRFSQTTHWSNHYLVSLALALLNVGMIVSVFRFREQDECLLQAGEVIPDKVEGSQEGKYGQLLRMKALHLLAAFIIVCVGIELTIGGWIVTFMMLVRGGGPSSGYVASVFYGGLTFGRVALLPMTKKLGETNAIYTYTFLAILLQLVVWLVPSFIIGSVAVALIGMLIGPMYPIIMNHAGRIFPRALVTGSVAWIAGCGAAGNTVLPYFTGNLASKYGIESLQVFILGMMVILACLWFTAPKHRPS